MASDWYEQTNKIKTKSDIVKLFLFVLQVSNFMFLADAREGIE